MGAIIVRVWLVAVSCWSFVWVLAFFLFLHDDPPSVSPIGFQHIWVMIALPWAATLLVELVLMALRQFIGESSRDRIHLVLDHEKRRTYRTLWI
jgi:hypothetical protein